MSIPKSSLIYETLGDAFVRILTSLDKNLHLSEAHLEIARAIQDAFICDVIALVFPDEEGIFVKKVLFRKEHTWRYQVSNHFDGGILMRAVAKKELVCENNPSSLPDYKEAIDGIAGEAVSSMMYLPLTYLDKLQAVIQLVRFDDVPFQPEEKESLLSSAGFIASIFYNTAQSYHLRVVNAELEASGWELKRSRNTLRALFDHMPYSVYIIDQDYRLNAVNMARCRRVNEDPRVLNGKVCYRVLYGYSEPCPDCLVSETLITGKATHRKKVDEKDLDEQIEWEIDTYPIFNEEGQVVQAILFEQDVTESRRLEMIIAQSEKLAAIGQLAAGVAHEINNPLTVILANTQILLKELPDNEDWREALDLIEKASIRAQQVVRNMLGLARREEYDFQRVNINDNIQKSLQLIRHELLVRAVELEFEPAVDLPDIMASEDHLQGVWMNIILNAIDATENIANPRILIRTMHDESGVKATIHDNGHGIPPEKINRIFEPFYTTRGPGRQTGGTGLGLSVCHRIVRQHGGEIFVDSKVGVGTTFTVVLPKVRAPE